MGSTKHKLILASHPGKAIAYKYEWKTVNRVKIHDWFVIGDPKQAVEVQIGENSTGG